MKKISFDDLLIFENDDYLILNKPPHIATLDERLGTQKSLLELVREQRPDAQFGHRLDKETSGAIAVAKHPEAYRHLSIQFEQRRVQKTYHAFVAGVHQFRETAVEKNLKTTTNGLARIVPSDEGKPALTYFDTERAFQHVTLLHCRPITGRLHQIRAHAAYLKAPLVGDPQYGGPLLQLSQIKRGFKLKKHTEEQPLIGRVALHAAVLAFEGLAGEAIAVQAPYPKDLRALLRQLEQYDA